MKSEKKEKRPLFNTSKKSSNPSEIKILQKFNIIYDDRISETTTAAEYCLWYWKGRKSKETDKPRRIRPVLDKWNQIKS